ncbi:SpoIID/LytB domain-containing protein [Pseudalkalibacillus sp. R45]|uniref:SpoIID/LytB domain-containing protein n=1 Tax=Pseudalkalibacillus sp. R45 TaxID=3457433 RepID=UPI003FCDAFDD
MKKIFTGILLLTLIFSLVPYSKGFAQISSKSYPNPVNVQIYSSSNYSFKVNGVYLLTNKQNGQKSYIRPGIYLSVQPGKITSGGTSFSSSNGFHLNELSTQPKYAEFTSTTDVRSGAMDHYPVKETLSKVESATYNSSFVNGKGETWYNVTTGNNETGWVSSATTFIRNAPTLPLIYINNKNYRGSLELKPEGSKMTAVNKLDMEDYLKGVVPREMPASWHSEALKAQAIVARSYAANSMYLKDNTSSQVYYGYDGEDSRSNAAIQATNGLIVKYNGKPVQTFFHSTSGGRTANVGDVWNSNQASFPYLISVVDKYESSPHSNWSESFRSRTLLEQFDFSSGTVLHDVKLQTPGANGEVRGVTLLTSNGEKTITGNELQIRRLFPISGSYGFLKSNWFNMNLDKQYGVQLQNSQLNQFGIFGQSVQLGNGTTSISTAEVQIQTANGIIKKDTDPASITLNGKGWGHRIGMSQYGAKGYAENGWEAVDIVKHYFPNTTVSR